MNFLIDFNSYDSYVIHRNKYDNNTSTTFNQINQGEYHYSSDYSYSYLSSDIISLEQNISNLRFNYYYVINPKRSLIVMILVLLDLELVN